MTVGAMDSILHSPRIRIVRRIGTAVLTLALLLAGCGSDGGGSGPADSGDPNGDEGTLAFEIDPDWETGDEGDARLLALQDDGALRPRLAVFKNGKYLRVIFTTDGGEESELSLDIGDWTSGEAHSITATWGEGSVGLYVDGASAGSSSYVGSVEIPPGTPLILGSDTRENPDGGVIRGFEIFRGPVDDSGTDGLQNAE